MHALIIEDEPLIAISIEDVLRDCGFKSFDLASSPEEAFDAVSQVCPDLITSDVQLMPGSGIDTVLTICKHTPVPVIFITGNVADVAQKMPESVALTKPFSETNLRQAVASVMTEPHAVSVLVLPDASAWASPLADDPCESNAEHAAAMQIVRLPVGKLAAKDVDCISIEKLRIGKYDLTGSALTIGEAGQDESVSIEGQPYETYAEAEAAGLAWAAGLGVQILYQETLSTEPSL